MLFNTDQATSPGLPTAMREVACDLLPFHRPADTAAGAEDPRRPSALVIFPAPPADRCRAMADFLAENTGRIVEEIGPTLDVAAELLSLDDVSFTGRLRGLLSDPAGRALLQELLGNLQSTSADLDRAQRGIFIVRARLTAGLGNAGGAHVG